MAMKDYTGQRFGKIVVVQREDDYIAPNGHRHSRWLCKCDCGNTSIVLGDNLKRTKSCGCGHIEAAYKIGKSRRRHGDASDYHCTRLYRIWGSIKSRCYNVKSEGYKRYGSKGIIMCDEWKNNYAAFKEWALNNGYSDELSIDRINGKGNYEPSNCRWATRKEQQNNLSSNRHIVVEGERLTVAQFAERYNVPHSRICDRLNSGWSFDELIAYAEEYNGGAI